MKTAISLPDELFAAADQYAQEKEMTRSELYASALREYLGRHRMENLTEKINVAMNEIKMGSEEMYKGSGMRSIRELTW
jgi:metal-responsive CopG/Arc/MetJ family transcriptional regulator